MSDPTIFAHPGFLANPMEAMQTIQGTPELANNAVMAHAYLTALHNSPQAGAAMAAALGGSTSTLLASPSDPDLRERHLLVREGATTLKTISAKRALNSLPTLEAQEYFLKVLPLLSPESSSKIKAPQLELPEHMRPNQLEDFHPDEPIKLENGKLTVTARGLAERQAGVVLLVANGSADADQDFSLNKTRDIATKLMLSNPSLPISVMMMNEQDHGQMPVINMHGDDLDDKLEKLFEPIASGQTDTAVGLLNAARFLDRKVNPHVKSGEKTIHLIGNFDVNASEHRGRTPKDQTKAADDELDGVIAGLYKNYRITTGGHLTSNSSDVEARGDDRDSRLKEFMDVNSKNRDVELNQLNAESRRRDGNLTTKAQRENNAKLDLKSLFPWYKPLAMSDNKTNRKEAVRTFLSKRTYDSQASLASASARLYDQLEQIPKRRMDSLLESLKEGDQEGGSEPVRLKF